MKHVSVITYNFVSIFILSEVYWKWNCQIYIYTGGNSVSEYSVQTIFSRIMQLFLDYILEDKFDQIQYCSIWNWLITSIYMQLYIYIDIALMFVDKFYFLNCSF